MGIYFKDEEKKPRWESAQAILHKETGEKESPKQNERTEKAEETRGVKNSYGKLHYLKKGEKRGEEKEGFSLEAFEAPGTPLHTEKEKYLDRTTMKNITHGDKQMLFSSEIPLHNQALFYDLAGSRKSEDFLECMKQLIRTRGHRTLMDAFGFLDQDSERRELELLKMEQKEALSEEFDGTSFSTKEETAEIGRRMDTLNSRLLKKEAKERQLRSDLQLMLDQQTREEYREDLSGHIHKETEQGQKAQEARKDDSTLQRRLQSGSEAVENGSESEAVPPEEEEQNTSS